LSRRKSDREKILERVVEEHLPEIETTCKAYEEHTVIWAHGSIVVDVKDNGEWRRFRIRPKSEVDAAILGVA
jgi:hypothetical protein